MSKLEVDKVTPQSGTTLTIGDSGDTTNIVGTLQNNGSAARSRQYNLLKRAAQILQTVY